MVDINNNNCTDDLDILPFKDQVYAQIKHDCIRNNELFVDPLFKVDDIRLFSESEKDKLSLVTWKRATEIARDMNLVAKFIENDAHKNDLHQGFIGDCWFIAAIAAVSEIPDLFHKVVPHDQNFDAGIFHFRFWLYGSWYDVCVDDYLPVWSSSNTLINCKNHREPNEMWIALIEKAYAKVYGSYQNLLDGLTVDAFVDMSGGIQETIKLDVTLKEESWNVLINSRPSRTMAACFINADTDETLSSGLVTNHAYTITKLFLLDYHGCPVRLIRLRNPWGNGVEWAGAWSDTSAEWHSLSSDQKIEMEYQCDEDGEFYMLYDDFINNFSGLDLCHLTPSDAFSDKKRNEWRKLSYHGQWSSGVAFKGTSKMDFTSYWMNPQYMLTIDDESTLIVSLMQKYTRERKKEGEDFEDYINFKVYKIQDLEKFEASKKAASSSSQFPFVPYLVECESSGAYLKKREITKRLALAPGDYVIIPSCLNGHFTHDFLLRIFIEEKNATPREDQHEDSSFFVEGDADRLFAKKKTNVNNAISKLLIKSVKYKKEDSLIINNSVMKKKNKTEESNSNKSSAADYDKGVTNLIMKIDNKTKDACCIT